MANANAPTQGVTIMLRNVPKRYTAWELVKELSPYAPRTAFDFVYTPWDKNSSTNMGYAFVNFINGDVAIHVASRMGSATWIGAPDRVIKVKPAHVQGLTVNLQRFQSEVAAKGAVNDRHVPLVFERGTFVPWGVAMQRYCAAPPRNGSPAPRWGCGGGAGDGRGEGRPTSDTERPGACTKALGRSAPSSTDTGSSGACSSSDSEDEEIAGGARRFKAGSPAQGGFPQPAWGGIFTSVNAPSGAGGDLATCAAAGPSPCTTLTPTQMQGLAASKLQMTDMLLRLRQAGHQRAGTGAPLHL